MIRIDMDRNCSKYAVNCVNRLVSFLLYPTRRVEQKRCCPKKPRKFLGFLHVWGSKKYKVFP